jgi:FixJ family two-component response regulator
VLSDVSMPGGISGLELARKLRNLRPGLPVVLATGYTQWGARVADENFVFIAKPYRREALADTLRTAFEREAARQATAASETRKSAGIRAEIPSLVEPRGIEPLTFALRTRRSPS